MLEEQFERAGKVGIMPGMLKGKMWAAYQEHYQGATDDVERSLKEMFGEEFVLAYEDQMQKLSSARTCKV